MLSKEKGTPRLIMLSQLSSRRRIELYSDHCMRPNSGILCVSLSLSLSLSLMAQAQKTPELIRKLYKSILNGNMTEVRAQWSTIAERDLYGAVTPRGDNILHTAICMKHKDIAREILKKCKEPERLLTKENALGDTVLHEAAATDMTDVAQELLTSAPELLFKRNMRGETPLFRAAHYGKARTFWALADKLDERKLPADKKMPHLKRDDGTTILHITILAEFFGEYFLLTTISVESILFKQNA
jgi:hypothetical protein